MFGASQSQWRIACGMGGAWWQGLDYQGVQIVMRSIVQVPPDDEPEVWRHIQILEDEAKKHLNSES